MFRLSEALRSLEPENASRLRLALKFSREELILDQMKETQKLLKERSSARPRRRSANCSRSSNTSDACSLPRTSTSRSSWRGSVRCARPWPTGTDHQGGEARAGLVRAWPSTTRGNCGELPARKDDLAHWSATRRAWSTTRLRANKNDEEAARKEARKPIRDREAAIRQRAAKLAERSAGRPAPSRAPQAGRPPPRRRDRPPRRARMARRPSPPSAGPSKRSARPSKGSPSGWPATRGGRRVGVQEVRAGPEP